MHVENTLILIGVLDFFFLFLNLKIVMTTWITNIFLSVPFLIINELNQLEGSANKKLTHDNYVTIFVIRWKTMNLTQTLIYNNNSTELKNK